MNDGKFKLAIIDENGEVVNLDDQYDFNSGDRLALVKMSNGDPIPDDEPVFIFRARDSYSLDALAFYLQLSIKKGCTDFHQNGMIDAIDRFITWQKANPEKLKQPGITRGL